MIQEEVFTETNSAQKPDWIEWKYKIDRQTGVSLKL